MKVNQGINLHKNYKEASQFMKDAEQKYPGIDVRNATGYSTARFAESVVNGGRESGKIISRELSPEQASMLEGMIVDHINEKTQTDLQKRVNSLKQRDDSPKLSGQQISSGGWCNIM